jgi:hypothetical protein
MKHFLRLTVLSILAFLLLAGCPAPEDPIDTRMTVDWHGTTIANGMSPAISMSMSSGSTSTDVTIINQAGAGDALSVDLPTISDPILFTISGPAFDTELEPGESTDFWVTFWGAAAPGTHDATVTILSNDATHPVFTFGVEGIQQ